MQGNCSEAPLPSRGVKRVPWQPVQCQLLYNTTLFTIQEGQDVWLANLQIATVPPLQLLGADPNTYSTIVIQHADANLWMTNVTLWGDFSHSRGVELSGSSLYAKGAHAVARALQQRISARCADVRMTRVLVQ